MGVDSVNPVISFKENKKENKLKPLFALNCKRQMRDANRSESYEDTSDFYFIVDENFSSVLMPTKEPLSSGDKASINENSMSFSFENNGATHEYNINRITGNLDGSISKDQITLRVKGTCSKAKIGEKKF